MNESYVECMVARKSSPMMSVLKYIIYILTGLSAVGFLAGYWIFIVPLIIFGLLAFFVVPGFDLEFEYLYVDREITITELSAYPLIIYRRFGAFLHNAFNNQGVSPSIQAVCDDARTALSMAQSGIGLALLPHSMVPVIRDIWYRTVAENSLETEILFVCRKQSQSNPLIGQLLNLLVETIQDS